MATAQKKNPIPVRLDKLEDDQVTEIAKKTGLTKSEVLRRACRLALPKFLMGKVDIARVVSNALEVKARAPKLAERKPLGFTASRQ